MNRDGPIDPSSVRSTSLVFLGRADVTRPALTSCCNGLIPVIDQKSRVKPFVLLLLNARSASPLIYRCLRLYRAWPADVSGNAFIYGRGMRASFMRDVYEALGHAVLIAHRFSFVSSAVHFISDLVLGTFFFKRQECWRF